MKNAPPRQLKILVLSAKGWGTGSALRAFYIAQALGKRGHEVTFVKPIRTLPLWFDMILSKYYYFFQTCFSRFDVVFCVKPYPTVALTLWWQRKRGAKIVIDVDDLDYAYSQGLFQEFHRWLQEPWPKWADLVTYHNPKLREPLQEVFEVPNEKSVQLQQGVDFSIFNRSPANPDDLPLPTAEWLAYQTSCSILCFSAHLNNACDLEPVLDSFSLLLRDRPATRLLIAGGGPDQDRFEHLSEKLGINGFLHFTGYLAPRQVAACLKVSDTVLTFYGPAPANLHRASMKLREALACGLKVVATNVGEAAQWKSALFLSEPNPTAYTQAVLLALKAKKAPQGASKLVKKWDWTDCVAGLEKRLIEPPRRHDRHGR